MGIAEQIYLTIHIQRVVSEKKASNHKDCYCMAGKTRIEKIGSRMFVTVFFNLGFIFK